MVSVERHTRGCLTISAHFYTRGMYITTGTNLPTILPRHLVTLSNAVHGGRVPIATLRAHTLTCILIRDLPVGAILVGTLALARVIVKMPVSRTRDGCGAETLTGDFVQLKRVGAGLCAAGTGAGGVVPVAVCSRATHFGGAL